MCWRAGCQQKCRGNETQKGKITKLALHFKPPKFAMKGQATVIPPRPLIRCDSHRRLWGENYFVATLWPVIFVSVDGEFRNIANLLISCSSAQQRIWISLYAARKLNFIRPRSKYSTYKTILKQLERLFTSKFTPTSDCALLRETSQTLQVSISTFMTE